MKVSSNSKYDMLIEVECSLDEFSEVAASSKFEDVISDKTYNDFVSFLINFENHVHRAGFEIMENHSSDRPNSLSEYCAIFPANTDKKVVYTIMIVLRISDHKLPRGEKYGEKYYDRYAQENKKPDTKEYQYWEFDSITINKHPVHDYDDALLQVDDFLSRWSQKSSNVDLVTL